MPFYTSLWYLSRTPVASKEQLAKMNAIAKESLPNFDFGLLVYDVQGPQCNYAASKTTDNMWLQ